MEDHPSMCPMCTKPYTLDRSGASAVPKVRAEQICPNQSTSLERPNPTFVARPLLGRTGSRPPSAAPAGRRQTESGEPHPSDFCSCAIRKRSALLPSHGRLRLHHSFVDLSLSEKHPENRENPGISFIFINLWRQIRGVLLSPARVFDFVQFPCTLAARYLGDM
jgi:hypothetical protein